MPLAKDLIEHEAGGDRGVEGPDLVPAHRNGHDEVAVLPHQAADPLAFAADDDSARTTEITGSERPFAAGVEAGDPESGLAGLVEGPGQVDDATDGQMGGRAGRSLDGGGGEAGRSPFRYHDGVGADGVGGAEDGTQVVGVLDSVEEDQKGSGGKGGQDLGVVGVGLAGQMRHHTLVIAAGASVQKLARY